MTSHRHVTIDHDEIRGWIQAHRGAPARSAAHTDTAGALHIDFSGVRTGELVHISWQERFTAFDAQGLGCAIRIRIYVAERARGSNWFPAVARAGFTREVSGVPTSRVPGTHGGGRRRARQCTTVPEEIASPGVLVLGQVTVRRVMSAW
ncbi:hypothetical protein SAMN04490220_8421 [Rhodococcus jostii]|uniref:Uncharacterized protein n=1 Tax=Rhodococcus jostii TaxID=132919 RepID=A0A1H5LUI6_RHOJO|nr:hypothetical protein SAMN04490220_8421 [Rhodococcus jostii]